MKTLCPFCGAYSPSSCELREEMNDICPWEETQEDEPDPDYLRETRDDMRRLWGDDRYDDY